MTSLPAKEGFDGVHWLGKNENELFLSPLTSKFSSYTSKTPQLLNCTVMTETINMFRK